MKRCCSNCEFFKLQGNEPHEINVEGRTERVADGECRLRPPIVNELKIGNREFGEFPRVLASDWCGKFQGRVVSGSQPDSTVLEHA